MTQRFKDILILSDIDGTFLGKRSRIVERNLEAIERFKADGGNFTFNTGRTNGNIYSVIPMAGELANSPASLGNGCCLYDLAMRCSVEDYLLDPKEAMRAVKYIHDNIKNIGLRISTTTGFLIAPDDEIINNEIIKLKQIEGLVDILPFEEWTAENWYKAVVVAEDARVHSIYDELYGIFGDVLGYDKSGRRMLEIHRPGRNKASMLDTYRQYYRERGIDIKIYAVGDYENDFDMLKEADVAVCPSNALDSVKALCELCLCSNDEGVVADLIEVLEMTGS